MAKKDKDQATPRPVGRYNPAGSKKGPVLVVAISPGIISTLGSESELLQFPAECTYEFRTVSDARMLVVMAPDGSVVAHIKQDLVRYVSGPQWLIRDRDAR